MVIIETKTIEAYLALKWWVGRAKETDWTQLGALVERSKSNTACNTKWHQMWAGTVAKSIVNCK